MPENEKTVFVVDDETSHRWDSRDHLKPVGIKARGFDDPQKALAACSTHPPDLLITDVLMPGMTGIELATRVKSFLPQCAVFLLSGRAEATDLLEEARQRGQDFDLILKPVHPDDLLTKIRA